MKAWSTAHLDGRCSYDGGHRFGKGDRVFIVGGRGWEKVFCAACGKAHHDAGEDEGGEYEPPAPMRHSGLRTVSEERFDFRAAAANDRSEA